MKKEVQMNILKTIMIVGSALAGYHHYLNTTPEPKPFCDIVDLDAQGLEDALREIQNPHRVIITKATVGNSTRASFLTGFARPEYFSKTNNTFKSQCLMDSGKSVVFYIRVSKRDPTRNPIL